jgi:hypothetical protein
MHDVGRERARAWARLLEGSPAPAAGATDRIAGASTACRSARSGVAVALGILDARRDDRSHDGLSREWVACLDDILAIADRACVVLAAAREQGATAPWPVWESRAPR